MFNCFNITIVEIPFDNDGLQPVPAVYNGSRHENGIPAAGLVLPVEIHFPGREDLSICKESGIEIAGAICASTDLQPNLSRSCLLEIDETRFAFTRVVV